VYPDIEAGTIVRPGVVTDRGTRYPSLSTIPLETIGGPPRGAASPHRPPASRRGPRGLRAPGGPALPALAQRPRGAEATVAVQTRRGAGRGDYHDALRMAVFSDAVHALEDLEERVSKVEGGEDLASERAPCTGKRDSGGVAKARAAEWKKHPLL